MTRNSNLGMVMNTMKFGDIKFEATQVHHLSEIRFTALEPNSNTIACLHVSSPTLMMDTTDYDAAIVRRIQKDLINELLKNRRCRKHLYRTMFNQVSDGYSFKHKGCEYGPYNSNEDAFVAYLLLMETENA